MSKATPSAATTAPHANPHAPHSIPHGPHTNPHTVPHAVPHAVPGPEATVVVLMHDGFYSCGTGAGRSNKAFLQVLTGLLHPSVRLVVMPVHLSRASAEYNADWHQEMRHLVAQVGGRMLPVDNGTAGMVRFGGLGAFEHACASAAALIRQRVLPSSGPLLITAFDCPFYGLAAELVPHMRPRLRPELVIVARATAALHTPDDTQRVAWERAGLQQTIAAGGRVAAISAHMRAHLADAYQLPDTALRDLPNGLTSDDWRHIAPPDTRLLPQQAHPGFVLAMGRAVPYKGFDDLLDALAILKTRDVAVPHTLLAAVTDTPGLTPYQRHLAERIAEQDLDVTLLPRFDPGLRSLLTHPALAAVVVPSRAEPFGRIPLEAFVAGAAPVVATTAGGLAELVTTGAGYTASAADPPALAVALHDALTITTTDRVRLRAAGRRAAARYNYQQTVRDFLIRTAPWTIGQAPRPPDAPALEAGPRQAEPEPL